MSDYPAMRIKGDNLRDGDLFLPSPGGQMRQVGRWGKPRGEDVLRLDYAPDPRSLYAEFDAWLHHATTGRSLPSKRWSTCVVLERARAFWGDPSILARLYDTAIVEVTQDNRVTLRTGGWPTPLTSQYLETFMPGWRVHKEGSERPWKLLTPAGHHEFREGMRLDAATGEVLDKGGEVVKSWPKGYHRGDSWQSRAY